MAASELTEIAQALVAEGKGILAADESTGTIEKRFKSIDVESTEETRRAYRELLFTTEGAAEYISGVILYDETIRQSASDRTSFPGLLERQGIVPGIKVDTGAKPLAKAPGETVTEGLDGLRERLNEYRELGARFTKWRAVIDIGDGLPTPYAIHVNAHALGRYAVLSQEANLVPIVEPEVLMDGDHTIERCFEVTETTLHAVFHELHLQRVELEGMLLKPNMVLSGKDAPEQAGVQEVAEQTIRCSEGDRPPGRSGDRLPVGRPERRARDGAPERDERAGRAPVGAQLLLRPRAPGACAQGVAREGRERRGSPGGLPPPGAPEQCGTLWLLLGGDGSGSRGLGEQQPGADG